ncbi:hypothetical protein PsorP6_011442 [Peronosclerospora sorghi]|uniref:Uncharacterized protein n=1 Tax=Peronosclerospora sorghi TaxID=230839 RepID=A0ACC0WID6_9STRA|nr:hypothetical protein PsorP6_011442 [Peronosclerospora sorghi]
MATRNQTLLEAFNIVQQARPCFSINAGVQASTKCTLKRPRPSSIRRISHARRLYARRALSSIGCFLLSFKLRRAYQATGVRHDKHKRKQDKCPPPHKVASSHRSRLLGALVVLTYDVSSALGKTRGTTGVRDREEREHRGFSRRTCDHSIVEVAIGTSCQRPDEAGDSNRRALSAFFHGYTTFLEHGPVAKAREHEQFGRILMAPRGLTITGPCLPRRTCWTVPLP